MALILVLVLLPVVLVAVAAIAALVVVLLSSLRITTAGVEVRNYPQPAKVIPLAQVACFDEPTPVGFLSSLRPRTGVLVLTDGTRLPVRSISEPEAGSGVEALNARLASLRRNS